MGGRGASVGMDAYFRNKQKVQRKQYGWNFSSGYSEGNVEETLNEADKLDIEYDEEVMRKMFNGASYYGTDRNRELNQQFARAIINADTPTKLRNEINDFDRWVRYDSSEPNYLRSRRKSKMTPHEYRTLANESDASFYDSYLKKTRKMAKQTGNSNSEFEDLFIKNDNKWGYSKDFIEHNYNAMKKWRRQWYFKRDAKKQR